MKKLLILGGANSQVPAIKRAKELGYYVISCDYLPDNPGHKFSDKYINISTVDKEKVLKAALEYKIDGIIAYASDPSAESAAYVIDHMGLAGTGYMETEILAEKDKFRSFQNKHGFHAPQFVSVSSMKELNEQKENIPFPCIVKPVDASGSKGITKIYIKKQIEEAYLFAKQFSRKGRVIFEEIIDSPYYQLHGDGVVYNSKLIFMELGDQRFRDNVPIGSSCPTTLEKSTKKRVWEEVERLLKAVHFTDGGINVEVRITANRDIYIVEIGPRTGGNYVPQLMEVATGFDEMTTVIQIAMKDYHVTRNTTNNKGYVWQYIIGAGRQGIYKELWIHDAIKKKVRYLYIHKKEGDLLDDYINSSGVIGVAILEFDSLEEMEKVIENIDDYVMVVMEEL